MEKETESFKKIREHLKTLDWDVLEDLTLNLPVEETHDNDEND